MRELRDMLWMILKRGRVMYKYLHIIHSWGINYWLTSLMLMMRNLILGISWIYVLIAEDGEEVITEIP